MKRGVMSVWTLVGIVSLAASAFADPPHASDPSGAQRPAKGDPTEGERAWEAAPAPGSPAHVSQADAKPTSKDGAKPSERVPSSVIAWSAHTLPSIGSTAAQAASAAGQARDEGPALVDGAATVRPSASLRALRRMNADHVLASLLPAFQACYVRSDSRASGLVVIRASVAAGGDVESTEITSSTGLPLGVATCVADRVHEAHFGAPGGSGVSVLVPARLGP